MAIHAGAPDEEAKSIEAACCRVSCHLHTPAIGWTAAAATSTLTRPLAAHQHRAPTSLLPPLAGRWCCCGQRSPTRPSASPTPAASCTTAAASTISAYRLPRLLPPCRHSQTRPCGGRARRLVRITTTRRHRPWVQHQLRPRLPAQSVPVALHTVSRRQRKSPFREEPSCLAWTTPSGRLPLPSRLLHHPPCPRRRLPQSPDDEAAVAAAAAAQGGQEDDTAARAGVQSRAVSTTTAAPTRN